MDEEELDYDYDLPDVKTEEPEEPETAQEDIYGDLYDQGGDGGQLLKSKYAALEEKCRGLEAQIANFKQQVKELTDERDHLGEEKRILIRNISCLYMTAKEDIARSQEVVRMKNEELLYYQMKIKSPGSEKKLPPRFSPAKIVENLNGGQPYSGIVPPPPQF